MHRMGHKGNDFNIPICLSPKLHIEVNASVFAQIGFHPVWVSPKLGEKLTERGQV